MRADKFFTDKFGSRTKAAEALKIGLVLRGDKQLSPDDDVREGELFTFLKREEEYVSGGGYKLARGLDVFGQSVQNLVFADLGASTGGFTDCLLKKGAKHVFCVDVGESQLSSALSHDPRVTVMDNTNARYLAPADFPVMLEGVVGDLSFISLRLILPAAASLLPDGGNAFFLFKPQFECGGKGLNKNGVCPPALHRGLLGDFYDFSKELLAPIALTNAPLRPKKNIEYMIWLKKGGEPSQKTDFLRPLAEFSFSKK